MKKTLQLVVTLLLLCAVPMTAMAATAGNPMTYQPGTEDTVTLPMPDGDTALPYQTSFTCKEAFSVLSYIPQREGFRFLSYVLDYEQVFTDYTVRYLEEGTNEPLAEPITVTNLPVGGVFTERAIDIENYDLVGETSQTHTLVSDAAENVFTFYYKPAAPATVSYTVQYIDRATGEKIWPDRVVTDVEPGTHVIERPEEIKGYKAMQPKYEWDVVGNEVKIFIYYEYSEPILM